MPGTSDPISSFNDSCNINTRSVNSVKQPWKRSVLIILTLKSLHCLAGKKLAGIHKNIFLIQMLYQSFLPNVPVKQFINSY